MKKIFFIGLCCVCAITATASHIVGGELFYDCQGNNNYHITLKLYRDCLCQQCANYSDLEYVTIFRANGTIYTQVGMPKPDTVNLPAYRNPCQDPNSDIPVCITEADYTGIVNLPPSAGGYTLVYQRCCRNIGLLNLASNQGATFTAEIPDNTLATCNSSARFNSLPPIYICADAPLSIDYSATDPDGDSLVYSFCDPYSGSEGNCADPSPNSANITGCPTAPNAPPYIPATYNTPYNASNFTNSPSDSHDLIIDPQTGLVTGTPNTQGLYDITVCVNEYRNGHLINTLRRDFEFTVAHCTQPIPALPEIGVLHGIGIYTISCKSYTVNFTNTSYNPNATPLTYSWNFGVPGSTTDTSSLSEPSFTYPDTGTYLVHLAVSESTNGQLCSDTTAALVYVYPTFTANFSEPTGICGDSAAKFADLTTSTSGTTNSWNWSFGDGFTSALQNPSHVYSAPGNYTVTLIDKNTVGCKDTIRKNITIYPVPVAAFADSNLCFSNPVVFMNQSTGNIATYNWSFGDGAASTSTLANPTYTYTATGTYNVALMVVSTNGCKDTVIQSINIHPLPQITTSGNVTICPNTSTQLSATGGITYAWSPPTGLSDTTIANPVATPPPPNSIVYTVTATNQFQCMSQSSLRVSFFPFAHADAGLDTSVCLNPVTFHDSVLLTATGGVSYQWSPVTGLNNPNIASPLCKPTANTTYYVTVTDTHGCNASDSVTVYVLDPSLNLILQDSVTVCQFDTAHATIVNQGVSGYNWNPQLFLTNPNSFNTGFYPLVTTYYILTVRNYCYIKSDSIEIVVLPIPQLGLPAVDSICIGNSYQFNAQNAVVYQWNPDPTLSSTTIANPVATPAISNKYIVTGTDQNGCVNKDSTLLLVYEPSTITIYPKDTPFICQGTSAGLRATGAYSYVWSPASSLSSATIANPVATPLDTTQYNVVATNVHGCKTYDSLLIKVQKPVYAAAQTPYVVCQGIPVQLHACCAPWYSWTPAAGLNDTVTNDPFALPDSTTYYIVKVFNDCFSDTAGVEVDIHPLPVLDAGNDTTIWRDTYAELHGSSNVATYFWDPSTWLDNALSLSTHASPPQTTRYYLFGIDQYGCKNKDSVLITVISHTELLVPTGFSPNGDGVNDEFRIVRSLNIDKLIEFDVFDRWGEKVFSTDNINEGWDGTRQGVASPMGVYVWMVIAKNKDGEEFIKRGNVTLLR